MRTGCCIWNVRPESVDALALLWRTGMPTREIARQLSGNYKIDVTKNAVIGKVHRLGLPARPSPLRGGYRHNRKRVLMKPGDDLSVR